MQNNLDVLRELNSTIATLITDEYQNTINQLTEEINGLKKKICFELYKSFQQMESEQRPFTQRVLSDHLDSMGTVVGFPPRHPIHWLKDHTLEHNYMEISFNQQELAMEFNQEMLNYITDSIKEQLAEIEGQISKAIDGHVAKIRQELTSQLKETSSDPRLLMANYIASSVPNPSLTLKEHRQFYLVRDGKRVNKSDLVKSVQMETQPWYTLGMGKKSVTAYELNYTSFQGIVQDSNDRCLTNITNTIKNYFEGKLPEQISNLYQQTCQIK